MTKKEVQDVVKDSVLVVMNPIIQEQKQVIESLQSFVSKQKEDSLISELKQEIEKLKEEKTAEIGKLQFQLEQEVTKFTDAIQQHYDGTSKTDITEDIFYPSLSLSAEHHKLIEDAKKLKETVTGKKVEDITLQEAIQFTAGLLGYGKYSDMVQPVNLSTIQRLVRERVSSDPHAKSIVENFKSYTIGQGVKFSCVNEKVQKVLRDFWVNNAMPQKQHKMVWQTYVNGEYFNGFFTTQSKTIPIVEMRFIPPQQIYDIERSKDDATIILSYERRINNLINKASLDHIADVDYFRRIRERQELGADYNDFISQFDAILRDERLVQYMMIGGEDNLRGEPPLMPVLKWLQYYSDWLTDRVILNHERSKVVWVRSIDPRLSGSFSRTTLPPKGAQVLLEFPWQKWRIENPQINAEDAQPDGRAILRRIGAAVRMPLFLLDQNAENENYASIRKSDSPFTQMILEYQNFWGLNFDKMFRTYIDILIRSGNLPKKTLIPTFEYKNIQEAVMCIMEDLQEGKKDDAQRIQRAKDILGTGRNIWVSTAMVPIEITFPKIIREDSRLLAETYRTLREIGVISLKSTADAFNLDWQTEQAHLTLEEYFSKKMDVPLTRPRLPRLPKNDELKKNEVV